MPDVRCIATKKALLIGSFFFAIIFSACSGKTDSSLAVFKALDEGLTNSTKTITKSTEMMYSSLQDKISDPVTSEKAKIWLPKAMQIKNYSADMVIYIEGLKIDLKKEAGLIMEEGKESFREDDKDAVSNLFEAKGKGKELYDRLKNYKKDMLAIDPQITAAFESTMPLTTRSFDASENRQNDFTRTFFDNTPVAAALTILSQFQSNINIAENRMASFCNNKMTYYNDGFYDSYSVIIGQNSSYVQAGEKIDITAGVGAFSKAALPQITINGRSVPLGYDGTAIYKFKASGKAGKHYVPVRIEFVNYDAKRQTFENQVEYTVAKEAAINY
jgi:gliding motility-associated protein GldM